MCPIFPEVANIVLPIRPSETANCLSYNPNPHTLTSVDTVRQTTHMRSQEASFSRLLHAIADPTRRKILQALKAKGANSLGKETGLCACDIEERVHVSQPTISHHMAILHKAGLVETQKQGHWRWYRRDEGAIKEFAKTLRETL